MSHSNKIKIYGFIGLIAFAFWLIFLSATSKTKFEYLMQNLKPIQSGEEISLSNQETNLYLQGFSVIENFGRWSLGNKQTICTKILPAKSKTHVANKLLLTLRVTDVLIEKEISITVGKEKIKYLCKKNDCEFEVNIEDDDSKNELVCLFIKIPETTKAQGDPRNLGYILKKIKLLNPQ